MNLMTPSSTSRSHSQAVSNCPTGTHLSKCARDTESESVLEQKSISLTTLQPTVIHIQPRMAQLETLEAKMANIEVSLSNVQRRKKNGTIISLNSSVRSIPKEIASKELENLRHALRDKENIIQNLKGQLTVPNLRLSILKNSGSTNNIHRKLSDLGKKQIEEKLNQLKNDVENKRLIIKNLKMSLEKLDITDNIDVRIQQAELEYQLGREELNLLSLLEETRTLQICLEECNKTTENETLFSCVGGNNQVAILGLEIDYNPKSPKFGAGQRNSTSGLCIDWALEETGLLEGDRLIEINGKIVLMKTQDDLLRLLSAAPDPAQIVILRNLSEKRKNIIPITTNKEVILLRQELNIIKERAEEMQKIKDGLKSDNIRLTHRISYLEEQVAELLQHNKFVTDNVSKQLPIISKTNQNVTSINITSRPSSQTSKDSIQVFQKGPQVTALVANLPGLESKDSVTFRSKSSLTNICNSSSCYKNHNLKHSSKNIQPSMSVQNLTQNEKNTFRKYHHYHHHHFHKEKDYNSENNSNCNNRYNSRYSTDIIKSNSEKDFALINQDFKKATKIVHELTRSKDPSIYEKQQKKCITSSEKYNHNNILKHFNLKSSNSMVDFPSEKCIDNHKKTDEFYKKKCDVRRIDSNDFDSDCNSKKIFDYASEPDKKITNYPNYCNEVINRPRPTPPKKPIRLSLHKTQSLQSVETPISTINSSSEKEESRKSLKRNHNRDIPFRNHNGF